MGPLETVFAFLVVMGIISIPLAAVITRKNSAIGQACADRIRRRGELREARRSPQLVAGPAARPQSDTSAPRYHERMGPDSAAQDAQQQILEAQQDEIRELQGKVDFLQRLLEERDKPSPP